MPKPLKQDDDVKAIMNSLRKVVRAIRVASHEAEASSGMSGAQLYVLQQLIEHPSASLREVAALTLTDQSSVSVVVGRLVLRKLVTRKTSKADARRVELSLTEKGRAQLRHASEPVQWRMMRSLRTTTPAELRTLRAVLARLVKDLGATGEPTEMFLEEKL